MIITFEDVKIKGKMFSEYGVYVAGEKGLEINILPEKTVQTVTINGKHGSQFVSSSFGIKPIPLPLFIEDINELDAFKDLIGLNYPEWIEFEREGVKIKGVFSDVSDIEVYPGLKGTFNVLLECYSPFFYEIEPSYNVFTEPTSLFYFNEGNRSSSPIYEVTGRGIVDVGVNGEVLRLSFSPTEYETYIVDTNTFETRKASENKLFSNVLYTFPLLNVGMNAIVVNGDCQTLKITPNLKWI